MPTSNFDIYATRDGYVAVTNEVRRSILDALADGDRQLPELVELTGRSKPTLSSVHLKELLGGGLVEEAPHPTDSRRKVYRLAARKLGSSNVPVEQLRDAVKEYVSISPLAARFPLSVTFDALAAAPAGADEAVLEAQAARLGELLSAVIEGDDVRGVLMSVARLLEREGLARPESLDLESETLRIGPGDSAPEGADAGRLAALLRGFVRGAVSDRAPDATVTVEPGGGGFVVAIHT